MLRERLLVLLLSASLGTFAQQRNPTDTVPKRDSVLLEELKDNVLDNIPVVSLDENDMGDGGAIGVSSSITTGRDPFFSAASYNFSSARFRLRGYDNDFSSTYMNGIPMDNLDNGFTPFGLWGGLNDVMRNRNTSFGLAYNTFSFGDFGSNTTMDTRASKQRKTTNITYANSNRNYTHRFSITHSTGMSKKGWAFTFSGSRRYAAEGYVPGTFYDGWSYFVGVDKRINHKQLLSLVAFGAPTENGRQGATVQEMYDLSGDHYYNPNWGYQNGKKRNASVAKTNQPVIILTHDFKISKKSSLITAAGYSFGDRSVTALDWYNAPDPRPDYYRYLPSYTGKWASVVDPVQAAMLDQQMRSDINLRQINWQRLYDVNRASYEAFKDSTGQVLATGLRSHYVIQDRIINTKRFNASSVLNSKLTKSIDLTVGASYQLQKNHYYQTVNDLLGGDYYVNINQFAERDYRGNSTTNQFDVNNPNRILHVGDKYGYDYNINIQKAAGFAEGLFKVKRADIFLAGQVSTTSFYREGFVKSGLFPNNSFGKSTTYNFTNYGVKGGVTYKVDARNYLYANGGYMTRAPYFENVYISPRTRDFAQDNVTSEDIQSAEAGYIYNGPTFRARLNGYYTHTSGGMDVMSFFDDSLQTFVNYGLSNIAKVHFGGELGVEINAGNGWTINAAASVGRYYYDSKQTATITADNGSKVPGSDTTFLKQTIYMQNFRVPGTPQEAYSLGITYRSRNYWFVSLTGEYFDQSYLSMNPRRRTYDAVSGLDKTSAEYHIIFDQTKFDPQYTVDFFGGYSYKLPKKFSINNRFTLLVFNVGVSNLLNNKNIITGGYEQLRFVKRAGPSDNLSGIEKFPPKLYYAYGINYFASVSLRF